MSCVIGARANSMLSFLRAPRFSPDAKFINVNLDGNEIGHNRAAEVGIIGDAKLVLAAAYRGGAGPLQSARGERPGSRNSPPSIAPTMERNAPLLHSDKVPIHPLRLCNEVKDVISPRHHPGR